MNRASRLALALTACAAMAVPVSGASGASPLLFSVSAGGSAVAKAGAAYTITVRAGSTMAWFTDRPARRAGLADVGGLVDGWTANRFDSEPPNAAVVMPRGRTTRQVVVTLTSAARQGANVVFTAVPLPSARVMGRSATGALRPGRYGRTELFIDDGAVPPCGYQASNSTGVDCTLSPGNGWVALGIPSRFTYGASLTVANVAPGAPATSVSFTHTWLQGQLCPNGLCYSRVTNDETMTTPFTRTFDALGNQSRFERVQVNAPTAPGTVLRVTISRR